MWEPWEGGLFEQYLEGRESLCFHGLIFPLSKPLKNTKLYCIEFLRTEMTSDPQTEIENTSRKGSILCDSLKDLTSFLSSKT